MAPKPMAGKVEEPRECGDLSICQHGRLAQHGEETDDIELEIIEIRLQPHLPVGRARVGDGDVIVAGHGGAAPGKRRCPGPGHGPATAFTELDDGTAMVGLATSPSQSVRRRQ